jgi:hypothetical protein
MSYRKKSEGVAHVVEHLSSKNDTPELQKKNHTRTTTKTHRLLVMSYLRFLLFFFHKHPDFTFISGEYCQ